MEAKQVPWWRKALSFALNGIRSGFGLFARTQKDNEEIEPEKAAGREEIREEEIDLTDHSPEPESKVELAEASEAAAAPDAVATASAADSAAGPETAGEQVQGIEALVDRLVNPEADAVAEETAPAPAAEPEAEVETAPPTFAEVEVVETPDAPEPTPELDAPIQAAEAVEPVANRTVREEENPPEEAVFSEPEVVDTDELRAKDEAAYAESASVQTADETVEELVSESVSVAGPVAAHGDESDDSAPEVIEGVRENLATSAEPAPEAAIDIQKTYEAVDPAKEVEAAALEVPHEEALEVETSMIAGEATAPETTAETGAAKELVESAADEAELIEPEPIVEIADLSAEEETDVVEMVAVPEILPDAEVTGAPAADGPAIEEQVLHANVPEPEEEPRIGSARPEIEAIQEQMMEPRETVENDSVDEVASQAESASNEEMTPESASPVPDEIMEPVVQAADEKIKELVVEVHGQVDEPIGEPVVEQNVEQVVEPSSKPDEQDMAEDAEEAQKIDQATEEPMELNHPNPEPSAEAEETAEAAAPALTAELEAAVEESAEAPSAAGNDGPSTEEAEDTAAPAVEPVAAHPSKPFIKLEPREGETNVSPFSVIVSQVYDGPLDLLLDLIRKQDIDIYDIPIARITAQFLAYVDQLKASDVDVAGEFIYTASLLIHIKSKMLLPRAPSGPEEATEDPRRELVERLLEHERFKNAAQMLQQKQMLEAATWTNPGVRDFKEDAGAEPEIAADTVDLVRVFREILDRARNRPVLNLQEDSVTVGQMIQFLSRRLTMEDKPVALRKILSHTRSERALIAMFLALLELVRLQAILLRQDRAFSEIFIKKHTDFESVMNQGLARDDWQ